MRSLGRTGRAKTPIAGGVMARLAVARLVAAGIDPAPLLHRAGIAVNQIEDTDAHMAANSQVFFLNLVADALHDDLLGFHLAEEFELRLVDLLYFVLASSATLGEALAQMERYNSIANESLVLSWEREKELKVGFSYAGIARHTDRHQMEFWMTTLIRICRHLTGSNLRPIRICFAHPRCAASEQLEKYLGCAIVFAAGTDEIAFARGAAQRRLRDAEPYLNKVLVRQCEDILSQRGTPTSPLQANVENAIIPLLPQGKVRVNGVAQALGMSRRTLARRLAEENLTFSEILDRMRTDLARHYLKDPSFSISQIAWRLGFQEVPAFTTAFKRWTGFTPTQMRTQRAYD
ncbi:AraC family transcriptional regulator [Microvirga sp. BT689]|uniref:AraC family transcriptional regulator n=1 Tax=Microvirga arvi TaxID=2778731 RepID=UPI0019528BE4|nr:AraC family transcriptional regulator [Microvirga arvi]MBM6580827.1 AraC family transcriptional regulator [Microvirga arvi]